MFYEIRDFNIFHNHRKIISLRIHQFFNFCFLILRFDNRFYNYIRDIKSFVDHVLMFRI
jgi:hypothetical protein